MPFKVAVAVHSVLVIILLTILPESLSAEVREANVKKLAAEREAQRASDSSLVKRCLRRASAPLEPLRIFLPKANASFVRGDYNLTVVAAVEFLAVLTRVGTNTRQLAYYPRVSMLRNPNMPFLHWGGLKRSLGRTFPLWICVKSRCSLVSCLVSTSSECYLTRSTGAIPATDLGQANSQQPARPRAAVPVRARANRADSAAADRR